MALTKFFRIAAEGPTVDGRDITRAQIQQMADTYNPETYTARINCEHLRGYSPEGPFNAWGSIVAAKAEEFTMEVGGKSKTLLGLYAQFDVTPQAKAYNKAGQKLFSSVEIFPNFANTNKAYLAGSAVTDTPASLGTEMLQFSRDDKRKDNLVQVHEFTVEYEDEAEKPSDMMARFFTGMTEFFSKGGKQEPETPPAPPITPAPDGAAAITQFMQGFSAQMEGFSAAIQQGFTALEARIAAQGQEVETLKSSIENNTPRHYTARPQSSGGDGRVRAEC